MSTVPNAISSFSNPSNPFTTTRLPGAKPGQISAGNLGQRGLQTHNLLKQRVQQNLFNSPLTLPQKLKVTQEMATQWFKTYKGHTDRLIRSLQSMGVEVYDGGKNDMVRKQLKHLGALGQFMCPMSISHPGQTLQFDFSQATPLERRIGQLAVSLYQREKMAYLYEDKASLEIKLHEAFHFAQTYNGLPFYHPNLEKAVRANEFVVAFYSHIMKHPLRAIGVIYIQNPSLWVKRKLGFLKVDPHGVGAAVRLLMDRELETTRFLTKNGKAFGLSYWGRFMSWYRSGTYKLLRHYSYVLENQN